MEELSDKKIHYDGNEACMCYQNKGRVTIKEFP